MSVKKILILLIVSYVMFRVIDYYIYKRNSVFLKLINNWENNKTLVKYNNKHTAYLLMQELGIRTAKLYYNGNYDDIDPRFVKRKHYVIKPVHGHSRKDVFLMSNGINLFTGKRVGIDCFNKIFKNRLVRVEEFLTDVNGEYNVPSDYKIFVFNGKAEIVLQHTYENNSFYKNTFDLDYNRIVPIKLLQDTRNKKYHKPKHFDELIRQAEYIGNQKFKNMFLRLDFYIDKDGPVFGEITPHPAAGGGYTEKGLELLDSLCVKHNL